MKTYLYTLKSELKNLALEIHQLKNNRKNLQMDMFQGYLRRN